MQYHRGPFGEAWRTGAAQQIEVILPASRETFATFQPLYANLTTIGFTVEVSV